MEKLDFEGFLSGNKKLLIISAVVVVLAVGAFFGYRYYNYKLNRSADKYLWTGVRLYMSFNGKNPAVLTKSISRLNKLKTKYGNTKAAKISNFYLGLDYFRLGKLKNGNIYLSKYVKFYPKPDANNLTYLAYSNMANIALSQKNYKAALIDLKNMSKIDGIKVREYALFEEASLYTQMNKPEEAISVYKKMLTNDAVTKKRGYIENLIQLNERILKSQKKS